MIKEYKSMADLPESFGSSVIPQSAKDLALNYAIKHRCVMKVSDGKEERYVYIVAIDMRYRDVVCLSVNGDSLTLYTHRAFKKFEFADRKYSKIMSEIFRKWYIDGDESDEEDSH